MNEKYKEEGEEGERREGRGRGEGRRKKYAAGKPQRTIFTYASSEGLLPNSSLKHLVK